MLFADERRLSLSIPAADKDGCPANIAFLIEYLCDNVLKDTRKELFVLDNHLCVSFHPVFYGHISPTMLQQLHSSISPLWSVG